MRRGAAGIGGDNGKRERPLRGSERKWEDILKRIFKKSVGAWTGFVWVRIGTRKQALVNAVMNLRAT